MQHLGDFRVDDYIAFGVQLHRFSSGAVYAPTGNVTYTFYENNSTSGAPTGGNLAQLNSKTGLYTARVQLTNAAGFEAGKDYFVHVEATVDSVAAAELFMFRVIDVPSVKVADYDTGKTPLQPTVAGRTLDVSAGGEAGVDWANVGSPTTAVDLSGTTISVNQGVASVSGNVVGNVNGSVGSVIGAVGSVAGNVDGSAGSVLGNVLGNVVGSVGSLVSQGTLVNTTDLTNAANAIIGAMVTPPSAGTVAAAVWDEDLTGHTTPDSAGEALGNAGGGTSAATIADAVWDEALSGHTTAGTAGKALSDAQAGSVGAGSGSVTWTYTITSTADNAPISDVDVWVTTDSGGSNIVASGKTDAFGVVTFQLDPGTYFVFRQKAGWDFQNPDQETVA